MPVSCMSQFIRNGKRFQKNIWALQILLVSSHDVISFKCVCPCYVGVIHMFCVYGNRFDKSIRYASRKARADVRRRVKGRFVKAGEAYDYDPLSQTRSC